MKLDSIGKRLGIILLFAGLVVFLIMIFVWVFTEPQFVAYPLRNGNVIYYKRGIMETMIAEWLGITLFALPLCLCGIALTMGYGGKLWNWLLHGHGEEKEDNQKEPVKKEN